jgi:serine protease inhibitor
MMFQRKVFPYSKIPELDSEVLEIPFATKPMQMENSYGTGLSMIVVLPRQGLSLSDAMAKVYLRTMNKIYRELYNSRIEHVGREVEVHLPRFEITSSFDFKDTLDTVRMTDFLVLSLQVHLNVLLNFSWASKTPSTNPKPTCPTSTTTTSCHR